jgi:signal transduction histidine kinase
LKLLAIDDNRDNLTTLKAVVGEVLPDGVLLTALNGLRGIELARAEDPDVILLDIVMPGLDGFAVCRKLKADERLQAIPVIFLTALRTDRESRVKALETGAEGFLSKPLDAQELVAQIRAMAKLKAANLMKRQETEHLAALVAERTRELEQELADRKRVEVEQELLQAQKLESVGRLAGGVAHDFNNLLMGIMGYADLCRDALPADHPNREWLDEITADAQRSADITRQLLAFARKQTITPKVLDLNDALTGMLKMLRRLIGEDIDLVWMPGASLGPVRIDPSQIDQVLANLCVNARDAISGTGRITIETANVAIDAAHCACHEGVVPGDYVLLAVSDDGCGMEKSVLAHLFEPFFTTKELGKGTGLGLATVYGIVKQNNGFISVYSEPQRGTTFRVYLPRFAGAATATTVVRRAEAPRGRGETVLLVEDEKSLRVTCGLFLNSFGYRVLVAETPAAALALAAQHAGDIQLLLTDVVMPGMDGRQLAQRLAALKPGMRVLFMSGYTANVVAHHGVLDPSVHFIGKPFSRDDLAGAVREVLDGGRPHA